MLDLLQGELRGLDRRSALGRLGLISGWLQAYASVRAAWCSAEEAQKVLWVVAIERDLARKEATGAEDRCHMVEAELKALQDQQTAHASQLQEREEKLKAQEAAVADRDAELKKAALEQAAERDRLTKLKDEAEADQASLTEARKAAVMERNTLVSLEARFHKAQRSLFGDDSSKKATVTTPRESPAALLPEVLAVCSRMLSTGLALWWRARFLPQPLRVSSAISISRTPASTSPHSLLRWTQDSRDAAAAAVKSSVDAMLSKFLVFGPPNEAEGTGDAPGDEAPLVGDGGTQV